MKNLRKQEKLLMLKATEKWFKIFPSSPELRSFRVVKRGHASHMALIAKCCFQQIKDFSVIGICTTGSPNSKYEHRQTSAFHVR